MALTADRLVAGFADPFHTPILLNPTEGPRMSTMKKNRAVVINRHGRICWLCGQEITSAQVLTLDHVVPYAEGGSNRVVNLRPAHFSCNQLRANPRWNGREGVFLPWRSERQRARRSRMKREARRRNRELRSG